MKLARDRPADISIVLHRFANETGEELDAAAQIGLREFLIGTGIPGARLATEYCSGWEQ